MAKTTQIQIRCDEFQKQQLREMAEREGTTISQLLLERVLGASGRPFVETLEKERQAVENDPANLNVTLDNKGAVVAKEPGKPMAYESPAETVEVATPSEDELRAKAKALVVSEGLRYRVAYAQVVKEAAES